jgi:dihydrofolate reductase
MFYMRTAEPGEQPMGRVILELSMSLDGYAAGPNDSPENGLGDGGERLFTWYFNGDVPLRLPGTDMVFHVSRASADLLQPQWNQQGAMVAGRRMFDIAHAWDGSPPGGTHCFILTHHPPAEWVRPGSPFTFVTDGIESAIRQAQAVAGDKVIGVGSANVGRQALKAGLLDELWIDLAPCLLGGGVRLFETLGIEPVDLEIMRVVEGKGVTHLAYRIIR